jgi:hypothetical protein
MGKYFIISLGVALTWSVIPRGSSLGSRVTGSVGSGQAEVRLKTNVGSIEIK